MKLAYIILAHRYPQQLLRLIRRLQEPGASFFVHIDKKAGNEIYRQVSEQLKDIPNIYFLKRYECFWGDFKIVRATIEGINKLVESGVDFDYTFLLSGQDYLSKSKSQIKDFLQKNDGKEFIQSTPLNEPNRWTEMGGCYQALHRILYWHFYFRSKWLCVPIKRQFPKGTLPYCGSQWWCLSRDCIEYIYQFMKENPGFVNYFKNVFIPDELFFQSIVSNSPFKDNVTNDDLRFIDLDNPNPNCPRTFLKDDFDRLLNSPKLFARKFDMQRDCEILDLIDERILGVDAAASSS